MYGSALNDTADNRPMKCPTKLYMDTFSARKDVCFVPSIIHNLTGAADAPNGFHKLS